MSAWFRDKTPYATLMLTFCALAIASCDPYYRLRYAVMNETDRPLYCVDKTQNGPAAVRRIEPDSFIQVYYESGIGRARPQFRESKREVASRFAIYSDSALSDSTRIVPRTGWKYYRLPIGECNARMYIRPKDVE